MQLFGSQVTMNSLVSRNCGVKTPFYGTSSFIPKTKCPFLSVHWGFCCFCFWRNVASRIRLPKVAQMVKKSAHGVGDPGSSSGSEDPLEKGTAVDFCLENPSDRGACGLPECWRRCTELQNASHSCAQGESCNIYRPPDPSPHPEQGHGVAKEPETSVSNVVKRGQWGSLTSPRHAKVCPSCRSPTAEQSGGAEMRRVKRLSRELSYSWGRN